MDDYGFDLYQVLELTPGATEEEIKKAYRKQALVHHPDRNGGVQSEVFLQLKTAYDVLVDPDKRVNYDAFHHSKEFVRDRRPLTAKEAAWLVDQQKKSWGVKEIHPFAVCILCESCPCPADGVCYACGMTFCQMCVRKMHCNGKTQPHYPCRNSTKFSEDLAKTHKEKERERMLLKGSDNKWLMHDEDFRNQRDIYRDRIKRGVPEVCHYWAWGQTKYTVHIAVWLASLECDADVNFDNDDEGRQRMTVTPTGMPTLLRKTFAHRVDEGRAGDALFFGHMHCMTFCLAKALPGERWLRLFDGDSDGAREMPLDGWKHTVSEEQIDGFKPVNHYRVAGRKDTASEWQEVSVSVPVPELAERHHISAKIDGNKIEVNVRGWMHWKRSLTQRVLKWEDGHQSRTHVDTTNSTWLLTHNEAGEKCVQFVLAQWMEGANKNQESDMRRQLEKDANRVVLEDADPYYMYELVECEMFLRAGAVFKPRSKLSKAAEGLLEEMEKHEEREGRSPKDLRQSPLEDLWLEDADESQLTLRDEEGGEIEEAAEWWAEAVASELEEWCEEVREQQQREEMRREDALKSAQKAARFPVKLRHALPSPNQGPCAVQDGHVRHVGSVRRVPLRPQVPVRARQGRIAHEDS